MIGNRIPQQNDFFQALMTRVPNIPFQVEPSEVFAFMRKLTRRGWTLRDEQRGKLRKIRRKDCLQVIEYLEGKGVSDLRFLDHALILYMRHKAREAWKPLVDTILKSKPTRPQHDEEVLIDLLTKEDLTDTQRIDLFHQRTRKSRATYFRIKARLKKNHKPTPGASPPSSTPPEARKRP